MGVRAVIPDNHPFIEIGNAVSGRVCIKLECNQCEKVWILYLVGARQIFTCPICGYEETIDLGREELYIRRWHCYGRPRCVWCFKVINVRYILWEYNALSRKINNYPVFYEGYEKLSYYCSLDHYKRHRNYYKAKFRQPIHLERLVSSRLNDCADDPESLFSDPEFIKKIIKE